MKSWLLLEIDTQTFILTKEHLDILSQLWWQDWVRNLLKPSISKSFAIWKFHYQMELPWGHTGQLLYWAVIGLEHGLSENWDPNQSKKAVICNDFLPSQTISVIEFLYTHEIDLSFENVEDTIQASQFYMITDLSVKCLDFLQKSMCVDKAMLVLHIAHKFGLKDVVSSSLLYIDKYARDILSNSPANEMFSNTL